MQAVNRSVLPGFSLSLGYTLFYLTLLVLIPLGACFLKAASLSADAFLAPVWTVQPVLESLDAELEEAAAILGATRWQTFVRVLLPLLLPALLTGFALALARALGEYGSVVFISGNMPFKTEIAPVLIVSRLEEFAYAEATAIAVVLLVISFAVLVVVNLLERWSHRVYA